ncbi:MAG: DNA repair protein RecN [Bacilli bacterium]|nr:DNA repair protein RecN [Bacilli bacterium]
MLTHLAIKNLAIIENIDVSFKEGFNVLTGATGAGKSLLIDSLSLLLGARASTELIRTGEEKALINGDFILNSPRLDALLSNLNIPAQNGLISIERIISRSKSVSKVNGVTVSLSDLNRIAKFIADIHSQFDFEKILNPENYLEIIDGFSYDLTAPYKKDYESLLLAYKESKRAYEELLAKKEKFEENREFYEYQYNELKAADLKEGEEEQIEADLSLLKNYDKIYELTQEGNQIVHGDFLDNLYQLNRNLEKLSALQKQYEETQKRIDERYYELVDIFDELKKQYDELDYDPSRLDELEQRESDLSALKRKYKRDIKELISYRDELKSIVGENSDFESELAAKKKEMDSAFASVYEKGKELSLVRQKIAKSIEKELERNLKDLLLQARFAVSFHINEGKDDSILKEGGIDDVDFLIETHIGEGLKSLSKVISGGEASRIMLAFKAIFIKANKISTVIFDEIDTGISGEAAHAVAEKIHEISLSSQVIAITHMPQVASLSDHHILISKNVKDGRTYTSIKELALEEKIKEIAYLISGGKITEKQLEYAKEMVLSKRD